MDDIDALIAQLAAPGARARREACAALGILGPGPAARAAPALGTIALRDPSAPVRAAARDALAAIGRGHACAIYAAALEDGDGSVRLRACEELERAGVAASVVWPALAACALGDADDDVAA